MVSSCAASEPVNRRERFGRCVAALLRIGDPPGLIGKGMLVLDEPGERQRVSPGRLRWTLESYADRSLTGHEYTWTKIRLYALLSMPLAGSAYFLLRSFGLAGSAASATVACVQLAMMAALGVCLLAERWNTHRLHRWKDADVHSLGLAVLGGFPVVPAWWLTQTDWVPSVWDDDGAPKESVRVILDRLGFDAWLSAQQLDGAAREVFDALLAEYDRTLGELLVVARSLR